jgi:hypothetical protein
VPRIVPQIPESLPLFFLCGYPKTILHVGGKIDQILNLPQTPLLFLQNSILAWIETGFFEKKLTERDFSVNISHMVTHKNRSDIIVTSNYHTRRAKGVFEKAWADSGVRFFISAAPSSQFHSEDGWMHRADSRTFFYEFSKTMWYAWVE